MFKLSELPKWALVGIATVVGFGAGFVAGPDSAVEQAAEAYIKDTTGIELDFSSLNGTKIKKVPYNE